VAGVSTPEADEGERQMAKLRALEKLRDVVEQALHKVLPDVDEKRLRQAATFVMVYMVSDGGVHVYLQTDDPYANEDGSTDDGYHFGSVESMQSYVQRYGPLADGKAVWIGEDRIR
jgi:hypothetical protein